MLKKMVRTILWIGLAAGVVLSFPLTGIGAGAAQASTPGEACLFSATFGAVPIGLVGHIGWGFQNGTGDNWVYGATEGVPFLPIILSGFGPASTHSWHEQGTFNQMLAAFGNGAHQNFSMGTGYYLQYRCATVLSSDPSAAMTAVSTQENNGYNLGDNNCLDKAVSILNAYQVPQLVKPFYLEFPDYYFGSQLPPAFGSVQYFTKLTIGVKIVDPLDGVYLTTNPGHTQRPIRILVYDGTNKLIYDSGFSAMATVTPGTDRYQATLPLPSGNSPLPGPWSSGVAYKIQVQLENTLRNYVPGSVVINQAVNNTVNDTPLTAGDINGDGQVSIADYGTLVGCYNDSVLATGPCVAADLNDDGYVNGPDYNEILRIFEYQHHS